jgi:predicted TIM-barrel fold metal-dependent hydrolase
MAKIDVHTHFVPDCYRDALLAAGHDRPDGIKAIPEWSEELAIAAMDRLDVRTAILSISTPGVYFGDAGKAADLARQVNEEGARLAAAHPGRFGFFASLPLPDVPAAEAELAYALDTLHADGVVLETHQDGMYLGDERLEPVYEGIARRGSVLFLHPTTAHRGEHLGLGYPRPMLEFMFDTTRSVTDMILSGVLERHPSLRVIVPHAGAALPVLAGRVELLLPLLSADGGRPLPSVRESLWRLHFDLAGAPVPELLGALLSVADPDKLHYGSDYPFTPLDAAAALADTLHGTELLDAATRDAVYCRNTLALFPRLR